MSVKPEKNQPGRHGHKGHMWMMAICCGLPIIGFLAIGVLGISLPSLETLLLLLCPVGMIGMMYFMHRDGCASRRQDQGRKSTPTHDEANDDLPSSPGTGSGQKISKSRPGWLKA